jgi:hypothetical protein
MREIIRVHLVEWLSWLRLAHVCESTECYCATMPYIWYVKKVARFGSLVICDIRRAISNLLHYGDLRHVSIHLVVEFKI